MEKCHICGGNKKHLQKINKIQQKLLESEIESLSSFYKIMGDQTRLKLLMSLETGKLNVTDLSCALNMTLSAVSHQLKVLRNAKLVKTTKVGKEVFYELDDKHIKDILDKGLEHIKEK